jgi:hypothetical protein
MPVYPTGRVTAVESRLTTAEADIAALERDAKRSKYLNATTTGTLIETVETTTIAAGTFAQDGDAYEIGYLFDQVAANACTVTIASPDGGNILADSRSTADDRTALVRLIRQSATTLRVELHYVYGQGTVYNPPSVIDTVADVTAAQTVVVKLTTPTALGNIVLVSRTTQRLPAVA